MIAFVELEVLSPPEVAIARVQQELQVLKEQRMQLLWLMTRAESEGSSVVSIAAVRKALDEEDPADVPG